MAKTSTKKAKKADGKAKGGGKKKSKIKSELEHGVETLSKLADHPLVSDLLAIGAMAAVAAIADHGVKTKNGASASDGSRKAVKAAGKAAAAAIGARILKEVGELGAKVSAKKN
jgi:hypothetical protein